MAGRVRDEDLDAVRQRADLVDVLSDHMQLKKAGRVFKGLCPFHDEKTPSFTVDPVKQLYHCFGCGEGGDVFTFLEKKEGLGFIEAVERLAQRYGINLRYQEALPSAKETARERLLRMHEVAQDYFTKALAADAGVGARGYLKGRGFGPEIISAFGLGYSPNRPDVLYRGFIRKGFSAREAVESGLCLSARDRVIDRFRGRLMFPIRDMRGRIIGFGGRALEKVEPKYMNSPETPIYMKRENLYALDLTRRDILKEGSVVLVEGYTDVLALYQGGVRNVAATLGTALTTEHFRQLSRFTDLVYLSFDADSAGVGASERSLDFYLEFDLDVRVASLPGGLDPADFMRDSDKEDFRQVLRDSIPLPEFCIRKVLEAHDMNDANAKTLAVSRSISIIAGLERKESADVYLRKLRDLADVDYEVLVGLLERAGGKRPGKGGFVPRDTGGREASAAGDDTASRLRAEALRLLLAQPSLAPGLLEEWGAVFFSDEAAHQLLQAIAAVPEAQPEAAAASVIESLQGSDGARNLATSLILDAGGNKELSRDEVKHRLEAVITRLQDLELARQIKELEGRLGELVRASNRDHEQESEVSRRITELERERLRLKGRS
ncbi:MAG: DNA primase [Candidatus Geothermincolia bacterium]